MSEVAIQQGSSRKLTDAISRSIDGLVVEGLQVEIQRARACGPKGCLNLEVLVREGSNADPEHLMCIAAFPGLRPHYRPWMEVFCIQERPLGRAYYDTKLEAELMRALCSSLGPGGKIFVEYYSDQETAWGLAMGIPPAATRQGYQLFRLGFTWFKDWYFSEGGHEGGQKLQGEKALDERARRRHMSRIKADIEDFLERSGDETEEGEAGDFLILAKERAKDVLAEIVACHPENQ